MKLGGIYISVGAKTTTLARDLKKAEGITKKSAVLMQQEIGRISFAHVGIAAAAFSVAYVVGMKKAVAAASDLQEVTGKFDVVFAGQQKQAEQMAKVLVDSYAMSTREAKQYMSSVQDLLVPMGMASDEALTMSDSVVKLAADLGSFNNLPTEQVMLDIQSALVGNFETMKKYGVILNETVTKEKAREMGLWDGKGALDANIKAQVAFTLMLEGSKAALGDQARTMDSYANQIKQLKANFEEIGAAIGDKVLPQLSEFVKYINEGIKNNPQVIDDIGEFAANIFKLTETLGKAATAGILFANVWTKTWQALGLASGGVITWTTALTDGASAVDQFETKLGRLQLELDKTTDSINKLESEKVRGEWFNTWTEAQEKQLQSLIKLESALKNQISAEKEAVAEQKKLNVAQESAAKSSQEFNGQLKDQASNLNDIAVAGKKVFAEFYDPLEEAYNEIAFDAAAKAQMDWLKVQNQIIEGNKLGRDSWLIFEEGAIAANERAQEAVKETTETSSILWESFVNDTSDIIHSFVSDTVRGEFESIGDMFSGLLDSMLDMLLNFISKAAANSLINALFGAGASGAGSLTLGSLFSGGVGAAGAASGGGLLGMLGIGGGATAAAAVGSGTAGAWMGGGAAAGATLSGSAGTSTLAGGAGADLLGGGAMSLGQAIPMAAFATPIILGFADAMMREKPKLEEILNENMINPINLAAADIGDEFESVSGKINDELYPALKNFDAASYDAASRVLVLGQNIGGASAATDELSHMTATQIQLFDEATGTWQASGVSMQALVEEVKAMQPAGAEAVTQISELIAAQHGLSSISDELESSYYAQGNAMKELSGISSQAASAFEAAGGRISNIDWQSIASDDQYSTQRALASYSSGTDYVPRTGLYELHKGESVVPASDNGSEPMVINLTSNTILDGKVIKSTVDKHIVDRGRRGVADNRRVTF